MPDWISDHAVHARACVDTMGAIYALHFIERNLSRRRGVFNRRIRKCPLRAQCQQSRRQGDIAHRNRNYLAMPTTEVKQRASLSERIALRRNLNRVRAARGQVHGDTRQAVRHAAEEMRGRKLLAVAQYYID